MLKKKTKYKQNTKIKFYKKLNSPLIPLLWFFFEKRYISFVWWWELSGQFTTTKHVQKKKKNFPYTSRPVREEGEILEGWNVKKTIPRPRIKIHSNSRREGDAAWHGGTRWENVKMDLLMYVDHHQPVYFTKHVLSCHVIASCEMMQSHLPFYMIWYQPVNEVWRGTRQLKS